jgi:hypothetical protein
MKTTEKEGRAFLLLRVFNAEKMENSITETLHQRVSHDDDFLAVLFTSSKLTCSFE